MSAIEVLSEIIMQGRKAQTATFRARDGFEALLEAGFIRETGIVQAVGCHECDDPHDAEIVFEDDQYGFNCPDLGFVPLPPDQVSAVVADIPRLVAHLADSFACKRRRSAPVQGGTWRVGAVETVGGDATIFFHPRLHCEQDMGDVVSALDREVRSPFRLILTAEGSLQFADATTAQLADVVELDLGAGMLTVTVDPGTIVGAPVKRVGGRPNQFEQVLTRLIRARIDDGTALPGRNEEATAILELLRLESPASTPSLSSIRSYLTKIRAG